VTEPDANPAHSTGSGSAPEELARRFIRTLEARDWDGFAAVMHADEHDASVLFDWRLGDEAAQGIVYFEFTDGLITKVTDFWPEAYDPPPGREHLVERW
jgi:hypothetical protein